MKALYICGNNAHKQSSFYIFGILVLQMSISLAAQRREMKLKIIINFIKGQIPIKVRKKILVCQFLKQWECDLSFYVSSFGAVFYN